MGSIRVVVLLLLLGLKCTEPASFTGNTHLSQTQALDIAIQVYNNERKEEYNFRVLSAQPQKDWDPTLSKPQSLIFTIKETECKVVENLNTEQCPFKDNGQVKNCQGLFTDEGKNLSVENICELQLSTGPVRARRNLEKFLKQVRENIKKLIPKKPFTLPWPIKF
ncbi:cathelicidin-related peptide-like [Tamandua tetradactyla]|uniref:cathelicidin-related peptide-like n=1 Tax=Tamandua tetradactyla TaxID=48850 RepID=UPI00405394E2